MNIEELKQLAEAATPGPWVHDQLLADFYEDEVRTSENDSVCADATEHDARFIAAANPAAVLELIAEVERLRKLGLRAFAELNGVFGDTTAGDRALNKARALLQSTQEPKS